MDTILAPEASMQKILLSFLLLSLPLSILGMTGNSTVVQDQRAANAIVGKHRLTLQWISRNRPGEINIIVENNQQYHIKGFQTESGNLINSKSSHVMKIEGLISEIKTRSFTFNGTINILLSGRNNNQPCIREGTFTFSYRKGKSQSWRLKEKDNTCHGHTDYIDIYVDRKWKPSPAPVARKPSQFDLWGIGLISNKSSWPPGAVIFPHQKINVYDKPRNGQIVGAVSIGDRPWQLVIQAGSEKTPVSSKDMKEVEYETSAPIVFDYDSGYVNVFRQFKPNGVWINTKELSGVGFQYVSWADFLSEKKSVPLFPRNSIAVSLRKAPTASSERITVLKGENFHVTPLGGKKGNWIKVKVTQYSVHPCTDGKGVIANEWQGWVKSVDDSGYPNLWYYTRGC